jgi:hypothetical protein
VESKKIRSIFKSFDEMVDKTLSTRISNKEMVFRFINDSKQKSFIDLLKHEKLEGIRTSLCQTWLETKNLLIVDFATSVYKAIPRLIEKRSEEIQSNRHKVILNVKKTPKVDYKSKMTDLDESYIRYITELQQHHIEFRESIDKLSKFIAHTLNNLLQKNKNQIDQKYLIDYYQLTQDLIEIDKKFECIKFDWHPINELKQKAHLARKQLLVYYLLNYEEFRKVKSLKYHNAYLYLQTWYEWTMQPVEDKHMFYKTNPKLQRTWNHYVEDVSSELVNLSNLNNQIRVCRSKNIAISDFFINTSNQCYYLLGGITERVKHKHNKVLILIKQLKDEFKYFNDSQFCLIKKIEPLKKISKELLKNLDKRLPRLMCFKNRDDIAQVTSLIRKVFKSLKREMFETSIKLFEWLKEYFIKIIHSTSILLGMERKNLFKF